jgi:hypothetical protein
MGTQVVSARRAAGVCHLLGIVSLLGASVMAQDAAKPAEGDRLYLDQFRPQPMLRVESHHRERAKFPVVDVHTHFRFKLRGGQSQFEEYLAAMDRNNVAINISLDGKLGDQWGQQAELLWKEHKQRFVIFVHIDWQGSAAKDDFDQWDCHQTDFVHRTVRALEGAHARGASGLKLFKSFGLGLRNPDGSAVSIDDPRWDPIWKKCGELGLVVLLHTADPAAFFLPIDRNNERWEELHRHPNWSFAGAEFPARKELLAARNRVIARHPQTKFIGAHMANNPEDLREVASWLDKYPNLYVEIASRIGELGRQPYTARKFFLKYADRILFGTDGPWPEPRLRLYWRFLETYDEYFPYSEKEFPPQGFWNIYGIGLPDQVLRKIYYANAAKIVPGVRDRLIATQPDLQLP